MNITLTKIPKTGKKTIRLQWQQLSRETVETLIAELYRNDSITFKEAQSLLNSSSWQNTAEILEKHGCTLYYDRDDFEHDVEVVEMYNNTDTK